MTKALRNWEEPDEVRDALQQAQAALQSAQGPRRLRRPSPSAKKPKALAAGMEPPDPAHRRAEDQRPAVS